MRRKVSAKAAELDVYVSGNHDGSMWAVTDGTTLWEPSDPVEKQNKSASIGSEYLY